MNLQEQLAIQAMYDAQAKAEAPETEQNKTAPKPRGRPRKAN